MRGKLIALIAGLALATAGGAWAANAGQADGQKVQVGAKLTLKASRFGKVLFDGRGYSLYLFTADRTKRSTCYGACAKAWPPFLTTAKPVAGLGINARLLGSTRRSDGRMQVTYAGHPLYYYVGDGKGEIKCQNVSEFGGLWLVVNRSGKAVR